jgi:DNA-binding PadR family transcriptional regulator
VAAQDPSNLGIALLSLLARGPRTGYQLSKVMERPVGYFWSANHSQIYGELKRLAAAGHVDVREEPGRGPRPTVTYEITETGRAAVRAWLLAPGTLPPVRDLDSLRVFTLWMLPKEQAAAVVAEMQAEHEAVLARYRQELADLEAETPCAWGTPAAAGRMALHGGIRTRHAQVEWCRWMRAQLDSGTGEPTD